MGTTALTGAWGLCSSVVMVQTQKVQLERRLLRLLLEVQVGLAVLAVLRAEIRTLQALSQKTCTMKAMGKGMAMRPVCAALALAATVAAQRMTREAWAAAVKFEVLAQRTLHPAAAAEVLPAVAFLEFL